MGSKIIAFGIVLVLLASGIGTVLAFSNSGDSMKGKILFDESHHQFWTACIDAGLADFAKELRNNGCQVDRLTDGPITYDKLKDYDVFVLPNGFVGKYSFDEGVKLLTDDEIKAIKKFVADGGGLFLFECGWSWADYTHLSIEKAPVNQLGKEFGIKLNDDIVYDPTNRYPGCSEGEGCPIFHRPFIKEHPITEGVYKTSNCEGFPSSLTLIDPSVDVVISGDEDSYTGYRGEYYKKGEKPPFLATTGYGKGKIVFAGQMGFLSSLDGDKDGIKNLYEFDNLKLGLNIIEWLVFPTPTTPTPTPTPIPTHIPAPTPTPLPSPTPSPMPTKTPSSSSVSLYGEKTDVVLGEDIVLKLSVVSLIGMPAMSVQVIIIPPSGMGVTSAEFVESGAGQYTTTYKLEPGKGRDIEVRIKPNQAGEFKVEGRIRYYFGNDTSTIEDYTRIVDIKVRETPGETPKIPSPNATTAETPGFGLIFALCAMLFVWYLRNRR